MADQPFSTPGFWRDLALETVRRPRAAARRLIDLQLPAAPLLQAALVITCCGILLAYLTTRVGGAQIDPLSARLLSMPLLAAGIEFVMMLVVAWLTWKIGGLFGGKGGLGGAATLVIWLNGLLLLVQAGQLVALALLPALALALALVGMALALWIFANFVTELHDFENPLMVMGAVVLTGIVLLIALGLLFAILGLTPQEVG
jgi:magnesium-transporting ATPase (P-type)